MVDLPMERRSISRLLRSYQNSRLYLFREHLGEEIAVGLKGKDEFGNEIIGYVTGIVGIKEMGEMGLFESVDLETGEGLRNEIIPIDMHTPIVEAFFQEKTISINHCAGDKTNLTYKVLAKPNNPNSNTTRTYHFIF